MKGDEGFRKKSKAFLQSFNEVFVYKTIIPTFKKFTDEAGFGNSMVAEVFFADCSIYPTLGRQKETVLALEDLNSIGYQLCSSRIDLDADHLKLMAKKIATFHAVSFAMRIRNDPIITKLTAELIPFHYKSETQGDLDSYKFLCPLSFKRLFNYVSNTPKHQTDKTFLDNLSSLKPKVEDDFLSIMENFLKTDHDFAVILHGDYYRNNVMFKYDEKNIPVDLKMFDFQEVRYATIAIDLSIFMFMHVHANLKPLIWDELLKLYHKTLIESLADILKCDEDDERLERFRFEKFIEHFKKFAFYGVAVSILSIPWMASPEEDTKKIADFFENDMHHPEFHALLEVCGGEDVNERMVNNVKYASDKGYMDIFR